MDTAEQLPLESDPTADQQLPEEATGWDWTSWYSILIITNAILGAILLEVAWARTTRYRKPIAALEAKMPAFRRNDSKHWRKWKLYPGAVTFMLPKFISGVSLGIVLLIILKITLCG